MHQHSSSRRDQQHRSQQHQHPHHVAISGNNSRPWNVLVTAMVLAAAYVLVVGVAFEGNSYLRKELPADGTPKKDSAAAVVDDTSAKEQKIAKHSPKTNATKPARKKEVVAGGAKEQIPKQPTLEEKPTTRTAHKKAAATGTAGKNKTATKAGGKKEAKSTAGKTTDTSGMQIPLLTLENYVARTAGKKTVLIRFCTSTCPPCERLTPMWKQLAKAWNDNDNGVLVAEVNCDDINSLTASPDNSLCLRHGIKVPFFKYGDAASVGSRSGLKLYDDSDGMDRSFESFNRLVKEKLLVNGHDEKSGIRAAST